MTFNTVFAQLAWLSHRVKTEGNRTSSVYKARSVIALHSEFSAALIFANV